MKTAFAILAGILLCGCAGPRPNPPVAAAVTAPNAWHGTAQATGAPEDQWWRDFHDPLLNALVERALRGNVDLAIAQTRVEQAAAQLRLARAQRMPNLVGSDQGGRQRDVDPFGRPRQQWLNEAQLSVTFDLDMFGRLSNANDAERAAFLGSKAGEANVRLGITAAVVSTYLALTASTARLSVLRDTLTTRSDSLRLTRRRAQAGYASMLDLRQAEAEYEGAAQLIPSTQQLVGRQQNALSLLLGENPQPISPDISLNQVAVPAVPVGMPSTLLRRRPDIAQAEQQIVAADRSLDSARAAFMPNVQLNGSVGQVAAQLLANPMHVFFVGGSVLAPIFDAGRLKAQEDRAAARRDEAAFAYRKAALTAFREVEDALDATRRLAEQEATLSAQREALAQALAIAQQRYRAGYSPFLEQLEAQRSLLAADLALVQVRADRLSASVNLFQALGGGWDAPTNDQPSAMSR